MRYRIAPNAVQLKVLCLGKINAYPQSNVLDHPPQISFDHSLCITVSPMTTGFPLWLPRSAVAVDWYLTHLTRLWMVYSTLHPLEELLTTDRGDTVYSTEKYWVHLG